MLNRSIFPTTEELKIQLVFHTTSNTSYTSNVSSIMIFLAQRRWNAYRIRHGLEGIHFASKVGTKAYLLSVYLLIIEAKLKYELLNKCFEKVFHCLLVA